MAENNTTAIPYYAHPHAWTKINDNTAYDETTAEPQAPQDLPFSTAVIAGADQGIDNVFVRLSDLGTKKALFGKGDFNKYGQASLQADFLFNGSTNVWFCRVLPDNATYANMIILANYRKGVVRDESDQETGLKGMEIKFSIAYANKPALAKGATTDKDIISIARSLQTSTPDAQTGYMTVPVAYIRAIGHGKYGNKYGMKITRDEAGENEDAVKMYNWSLIASGTVSRITNTYAGSLYQTTYNGSSTLISDVLSQYDTGMCPIKVYPFEDSFSTLYNFYQNIAEENAEYLATTTPTDEQIADLNYAREITEAEFDPIFGYKMDTKIDAIIPYYKNYTVKASGAYVAPDLQVGNYAAMPQNTADWNTAAVGMTCLVLADETYGGARRKYTIIDINADSQAIIYDDGVEAHIDDDQYDGVNLSNAAGIMFIGGSDGDFQEVTDINGNTRVPTSAEMKLLLAREEVKAIRGQKDKKILSPYRIDLDFIFDANYNMTSNGGINDTSIEAMYSNSTVLTEDDYEQLASITSAAIDLSDINVKQALFDLNRFRNRNGMTIGPAMGAGCHLHLDSGLIGITGSDISSELADTMAMFETILGRDVSVDIGSYDIFDPYTGKRISVTVAYWIALNMVPHLMKNGLNKPLAWNNGKIIAMQRDTATTQVNMMIRDSFRPDIDIIDWDVKELLYKGRFNYYVTSEEGRVVERSVQNTRQLEASQLLEENNCRVLNTLKKGLEAACRGYIGEWNSPSARKGYTDSQMDIYRPWIGTMVEDINIYFDAEEFEQRSMILHCYCDVEFRDIIKRVTLEININRADYTNANEGGE